VILNNVPPTVLLTGANGFIGRHIVAALIEAGYLVLCGVSARCYAKFKSKRHHFDKHPCSLMPFDFATDTEDDWHQRFYQNRQYPIEIVINAASVLRDRRRPPIEAAHQTGPIALFNVCAGHGAWYRVRRVIQISTLGVEGSATRAADEHVLKLAENAPFSAAVLNVRMQPVAVTDLVQAIVMLIKNEQSGMIECTDPHRLA